MRLSDIRIILDAVTHKAAIVLETNEKRYNCNDNKDNIKFNANTNTNTNSNSNSNSNSNLTTMTKSDKIRNINHNEINEDKKEFKSILEQIIAISTELKSVTLQSSFASNSNVPGISGSSSSMEINLQSIEIDDETMFNIIDLLQGISLPILNYSKNVLGKDINDISCSESSPCSLLARMHISGHGDYFSRVLLLNLKGNNLTDISCKVRDVAHAQRKRKEEMKEIRGGRGREIVYLGLVWDERNIIF